MYASECNGYAEVENVVAKSRSIAYTIEVGSELQVNAEGEVKLLGTGVGLGAEVASHLNLSYGNVEDISRSLTVKTSPGTNVEHLISLQEVLQVGSAKIVVNNQEVIVPFKFRNDFSISLSDTLPLVCPTPTSEPIAILEPTPTTIQPTPVGPTETTVIQVPTNVPLPTEPPPPTAISVPPTSTMLPTNVPLPTEPPPPTATFVPPTSTMLPTTTMLPPTDTEITLPTDTPIPSNTPIPPSTNTPIPPSTATVLQPTATLVPPTESPVVSESTSNPIMQVGPYWGWRNELGQKTLMLNILSVGSTCIDNVEIIIDGQYMIARVITDPNDSHYRQNSEPFEGTTGMSCDYVIGNGVIRPSQSFSVPAATYGINLPPESPFEWCYQTSDKTWYLCNSSSVPKVQLQF